MDEAWTDVPKKHISVTYLIDGAVGPSGMMSRSSRTPSPATGLRTCSLYLKVTAKGSGDTDDVVTADTQSAREFLEPPHTMVPITRKGGAKANHVLPNVSRTSEQRKEGVKDSLQILQGAPLLRLAGCGQLVFVQIPDGDGSKATPNGKDGAGEKLNAKITSSIISALWGSFTLRNPLSWLHRSSATINRDISQSIRV